MPKTAPKQYFRNAQTWKQISTNVPPAMYKALRSRVTKEMTMSQLLREMIEESEVMREGLPQPAWSIELTRNVTALRQELAELKKEIAMSEAIIAEQEEKVAGLEPRQEAGSVNAGEKDKALKWPLFGRLTEMLVRRTRREENPQRNEVQPGAIGMNAALTSDAWM